MKLLIFYVSFIPNSSFVLIISLLLDEKGKLVHP